MASASVSALLGHRTHGIEPARSAGRLDRSPRIAYFINHYPKVSHSFIRREILALERAGLRIQRLAVRGADDPLPDAQDRAERSRTHYLLQGGAHRLLLAPLLMLLRSPLRFVSALWLAMRSARRSDRTLAHHLIYLIEACRIVALTRRFGAEHLHAHFGTNSADVAMLARVLGGPPYSFTVHGPEEFFRPVGLREKIHRAAFVIAVSSFGRSQLYLCSDPADWPKIKVAHCGLEREYFAGADAAPAAQRPAAPRPAAPPPVAPPRLLCVGRLTHTKGQRLLIEAIALLAARGVYCQLVLAGDGPTRPELEALIARYALGDRIRITGWISGSQVREELLASRALVLASFAEGLPVVIMEAMALGRPVLSTYVAGIPELVVPGETGWLVPAGSVPELSRAMAECLAASPAKLRLMGEAALRRVACRHAIERNGLAELFVASVGASAAGFATGPDTPDAIGHPAPSAASTPTA